MFTWSVTASRWDLPYGSFGFTAASFHSKHKMSLIKKTKIKTWEIS